MLRILFEILLPLVLPTVLYLVGLQLANWSRQDRTMDWAGLPWLWLTAAGALLLAAMLVVVTVGFGTARPGVYVPPRLQNGRVVPGHIEPGSAP